VWRRLEKFSVIRNVLKSTVSNHLKNTFQQDNNRHLYIVKSLCLFLPLEITSKKVQAWEMRTSGFRSLIRQKVLIYETEAQSADPSGRTV